MNIKANKPNNFTTYTKVGLLLYPFIFIKTVPGFSEYKSTSFINLSFTYILAIPEYVYFVNEILKLLKSPLADI